MTSTIKVNNVQNQCGQNIINENSNTITIGASGDTIALASGASQTGFGRTGTVDWQTGDIKTSTFTAESGKGYFCNTTSGGFTVNLPAGSAGAIVSLQDYNNTFDSNAISVNPNGSEKINGGVAGGAVSVGGEGEGVTLVYIDGTVGWRSVQDNSFNAAGSNYIAATGGNSVATCGDFKIHTFTGPGTFCVSAAGSPSGSDRVEYIVVGGGGSGGGGYYGGGGGAGGFRFASPSLAPATYPAKPLAAPAGLAVSVTGYPITVGGGATSQPTPCNQGNDGTPSVFSTLTATGGGGGGHWGNSAPVAPTRPGRPGGSGGGSGSNNDPGSAPGPTVGGTGNTPPVSPAQGTDGGNGCKSSASGPQNTAPSAGGGGATVAGTNFTPGPGGPGVGGAGGAGAGVPNAFGTSGQNCGSNYYFSGGGAGAGSSNTGNVGGLGGGGKGGRYASPLPASNYADAGTTNTGGGGGGMITPAPASGAGGSGIVIIRYKFQN